MAIIIIIITTLYYMIIVADGCGRGAVDVALKSVSWSVVSGARTQPCDPPLLLLLAKLENQQ